MNVFSKMTTLPQGVVSFVREARQELKIVQWPTRRDAVWYTIVILVVSAAVAAVTGALDAVLTLIVERALL
jgi:preprotein translocase SecE subunit